MATSSRADRQPEWSFRVGLVGLVRSVGDEPSQQLDRAGPRYAQCNIVFIYMYMLDPFKQLHGDCILYITIKPYIVSVSVCVCK